MTDVWRDADPWPSGPFTHADALASGVTRHALRTAVASRRLRRVARGVYHRAEPVCSDAERWELVRQDHRRRLEAQLNHEVAQEDAAERRAQADAVARALRRS